MKTLFNQSEIRTCNSQCYCELPPPHEISVSVRAGVRAGCGESEKNARTHLHRKCKFLLLLMILFVVPVGKVVGQQSFTNALRVDVYDKCEFKTYEFYKFQQAWFVFKSKSSVTQIKIADHASTHAPTPVFDTVIVYDKNLTVVAVFTEDTTDWTEIVSTTMVGSDYYLFVKSNSYFDKCDFDLCLSILAPPGEITLLDFSDPNPCVVGDETLSILTECFTCTEFYLVWTDAMGQVITSCNNNCVPDISSWSNGTYTITACLYCGLDTFPQSYMYPTDCETITFSIENMLPPTTNIVENYVSACPSELCFHDQTSQASEVIWDLYYYFNVQYHNITGSMMPSNSAYCFNFVDVGSYMIVATVVNDCGIDSDTVHVVIHSPSVEFTWNNACLGDTVCFTEQSNCAEYWHWDFGDGTTSTEQNPCHGYSQAGNYLVTLEVSPGITASHTISVFSPVQPVISGDESACGTNSHYQVTPLGAFSQIGWAVNSPSGWVATTPPDEYNHSWTNGIGGVVYVETTDLHGCVAHGEKMVFDCCFNADSLDYMFNDEQFVFPTTVISNKNFYFNGEIVFTSGSYYTFAYCHFYMGGNAKVIVQNGAHVDIGKSGVIEACSGIMWDGFYVENGGELKIGGSNINMPVYVKDAKNAVYSINGGKFILNSVVMDKNFKHLVVDRYSGTHSGTVKHTIMTCTGTLLPQYPSVIAFRTQDAITVNSVSSIAIGDLGAGNTISNCDIGILSLNSFIRVVGNTFSNIEPPTSIAIGQPNHPRGYGIYAFSVFTSASSQHGLNTMPATLSQQGGNTFTNVTNGIYSFNNGKINIARNKFDYQNNPLGGGTAISIAEWSHPSTNKIITTNNISNYNRGILVVTTENARVSGNIVNNLKLMPIPFSNLRAMGIRIEGGSNNVVQGNTVQNNNASSVDWRWEGISVSNSGSLVVSCNTIRKMGKSIRFQGVNDPVQIKKNAMFNGTAGIVLSDGGFINEQGTSGSVPATATTPGNGIPWDNEWYGFSGRHLYTMNNTNASNIRYHVFSGTSPKHPVGFENISDYNTSFPFDLEYETGSLFILCAIPLMTASPAYSNWMSDVANNTNANLQAPMHRNWIGRNGLYKTLKEDSLLAQNASLQSFVMQLETESQGVLKKVQDTLLMNDYLTAKIMNDDLTPSTKPDSVFKDINSVCINAVMTNNNDWATAISQSGLDSLKTIAELCPFEYGEMVYLSRIMLKMLGDTTEYSNECEFNEIEVPCKSMMSTNNEMFINVFPNPASSEITIETDIALPATITFYSALGQIILIQDIYDESSIVDVRTISAQLVLYEIKSINGEITRGLLQISR